MYVVLCWPKFIWRKIFFSLFFLLSFFLFRTKTNHFILIRKKKKRCQRARELTDRELVGLINLGRRAKYCDRQQPRPFFFFVFFGGVGGGRIC